MKLLPVIAGKWICELGTLFLLGRFCVFSHLGQLDKLTSYQGSCRLSSLSPFSALVQYRKFKGMMICFKWGLMKSTLRNKFYLLASFSPSCVQLMFSLLSAPEMGSLSPLPGLARGKALRVTMLFAWNSKFCVVQPESCMRSLLSAVVCCESQCSKDGWTWKPGPTKKTIIFGYLYTIVTGMFYSCAWCGGFCSGVLCRT